MIDTDFEIDLINKMDYFTSWKYCVAFQESKGLLVDSDVAYLSKGSSLVDTHNATSRLKEICLYILDLTEDDSIPYIDSWTPSNYLNNLLTDLGEF